MAIRLPDQHDGGLAIATATLEPECEAPVANGRVLALLDKLCPAGDTQSEQVEPPAAFRPKVALVMPMGGPVYPTALRGYHWARSERCDVIGHFESQSSAAQLTFNALLADVLDRRDAGGDDAPTHLAMIHSDVEPLRQDWLDVLWGEMERLGLDLIAAVVPIKEPQRVRTSTAIGALADPFLVCRHVDNADRAKLPETFGPEAVCNPGEVLLLNNGLMLMDLRRPWWDDFAFTVLNRIISHNGRRVAQFAPEDHLCARHVQAHGGKVGATWAVPVTHHGEDEWKSHG